MNFRSLLFTLIIVVFSVPGLVLAFPVAVQKTGQTATYIAGDDGDLQRGAILVGDRFIDNGDGTVTDNMTGLIWLKNANCFLGQTLTEALVDAGTLNSGECGLSDASVEGDWRLPAISELKSLVNFKYANPPVSNTAGTGQMQEGDPFTRIWVLRNYWTSTTSSHYLVDAWYVNFYYGRSSTAGKGTDNYVWPVKGGLRGLRVIPSGTGSGTVISDNIAGIDCGDDCSETYLFNTTVTLIPDADPGSTFVGWSGNADCSDGTVTLDTGKSCTATFDLPYTITTSVTPVEGGSVICTPNPVEYGSSSICTITTNIGYATDAVIGTCGGTLNGLTYTTDEIAETCTVEVSFGTRSSWIMFMPAITGMGQ